MNRARLLLIVALVLPSALLGQQRAFHFFDPGNIVTIHGLVERIDHEDVYGKKSRFLVLAIRSNDQQLFRVEICPQWFFENDIAPGMKIQVRGSLLAEPDGPPYLIAQEISLQGESITLRDRKGFPLWSQRGGQEGARKRKGPGRKGTP